MYVSSEVITTVVSAGGLLLAIVGGWGWMVQRMDRMGIHLSGEIGGLRTEMQDEFRQVRGEVSGLRTETQGEFHQLRGEVTEVRREIRSDIAGIRVDVGYVQRELTDVRVLLSGRTEESERSLLLSE